MDAPALGGWFRPRLLIPPGFAAKLTDDEFARIQGHVAQGVVLLQGTPGIGRIALEVVGQHHERFDGTGYPNGLAGQAIPVSARIVAVVDVFDSLLHERPYKEPWPHTEVMSYITERAGIKESLGQLDALFQ